MLGEPIHCQHLMTPRARARVSRSIRVSVYLRRVFAAQSLIPGG